MISKIEFIELLKEHDAQEERIDTLEEMGLSIFDSPLIEYGTKLFEQMITSNFKEEGSDWIFWWLYEKDGDPDMKAWDENHNEIPLETMEDLWNLVEQYRV